MWLLLLTDFGEQSEMRGCDQLYSCCSLQQMVYGDRMSQFTLASCRSKSLLAKSAAAREQHGLSSCCLQALIQDQVQIDAIQMSLSMLTCMALCCLLYFFLLRDIIAP